MLIDAITRVATSRAMKTLFALTVLLALAALFAPRFIDTRPITKRLTDQALNQLQAALAIKGGVEVVMLPKPALRLHQLELSDPSDALSPTLSIADAELLLDLPSLLKGDVRVGTVRVLNPELMVPSSPDGSLHFGFLGATMLKRLAAMAATTPVKLEVSNGRASFANRDTGAARSVSGLNLSGVLAKDTALYGGFVLGDVPVSLVATRSGAVGATPFTLSLSSGTDHTLSLKGSMDFTADYPLITAKLDLASRNIRPFFEPSAEPSVGGEQVASETAKPALGELPLSLKADFVQKQDVIKLSNLLLDALDSKAKGTIDWLNEPNSQFQVDLAFERLDAAQLGVLFSPLVHRYQKDNPAAPKVLADKALSVSLNLQADQLVKDDQPWGGAKFNGELADGVLTVNQLTLALPGESMLALFGLLSVSDTQGLRFEGNAEARGKSLREMLTVFDASAANLPALGFGAFTLKSNVFVSRDLLRLSEAGAQFSELSLKGGLVSYFDAKPRMEADVILQNINFDFYRDTWRENSADDEEALFLRFDRGMNFDWLKKLSASIDFRVQVQGFTFLERKGSGASFRVFAQGGEFGIYNAKFVYDEDTTEGSLRLDVNGEVPSVNLVLNTAALNTDYFARQPYKIAASPAVAAKSVPIKVADEPLPEMPMPAATAEEEMRQKIDEEAATLGIGTPEEAATPEAAASYEETLLPDDPGALTDGDEAAAVDLYTDAATTIITTTPQSLVVAEETAPSSRWSTELFDMRAMEGINGTFDLSIGRLQHHERTFNQFKLQAKLERNVLSFQTLTFAHWGGSFSINGTLFGGKVPGLSVGFIAANLDVTEMLSGLIGMQGLGGRASISGTIDTSGVNPESWIAQSNGKLLVAGRGISVQQFDLAGVVAATLASRTAADVVNNVNLSIASGAGIYSMDGSLNLRKGVISSPGFTLKTGRVVGTLGGDFRLLPWDVNLTGEFKFPELAPENTPTLNARWSGAVEAIELQTDTQSLEAFVAKRITGN